MAKNRRLIDADALLERMEQKYKDTVRLIQSGETHLDNLAEGYTEVHSLIMALKMLNGYSEPVRHGQWLKHSGLMPIYRCSICDQRNLFKGDDEVLSPYCPNCGAKMDGTPCTVCPASSRK